MAHKGYENNVKAKSYYWFVYMENPKLPCISE